MLVYVNHLRFQGEGARDAIFKAIGAWLKEQMGYGLHPDCKFMQSKLYSMTVPVQKIRPH